MPGGGKVLPETGLIKMTLQEVLKTVLTWPRAKEALERWGLGPLPGEPTAPSLGVAAYLCG